MSYKIAVYCPDRHIEYNLNTLNKTGVGGGITARIRIAHALAKLGNQVIVYANCPRNEVIQGVQYKHYSKIGTIHTDIFIMSTSGGNLDLGELNADSIQARLRILMLSGIDFPKNFLKNDLDFVYIPSNFIRQIAKTNWQINPRQIFTAYYGVSGKVNKKDIKRDKYKLVFLSHPSKGLETAIAIFRILKEKNSKYSLHIFGGNRLWGEQEQIIQDEVGLYYHGLIGQNKLADSLLEMGFSLNLQSREEPFGMVVTESMQAGCIVLASPVGAYPELIQNGLNGFLISGDPSSSETHEKAADLIDSLIKNPDCMEYVRRNAQHFPYSWETIAKAWQGHWDWYFSKLSDNNNKSQSTLGGCVLCGGGMLLLADGLHCTECGHYQRFI